MAKNKKKKNKNKTKKLHFSDYKVTFLNHASYSIETKDELLLMDPWFFGRVFNNSWSLMRETQTDKIDFTKPLEIKAYQYDIVCNGVELSSGAIRNHIPELMYKLFSIAGYDKKNVEEKFSGMLNALSYGAPPHGGIAPGIDRIVMLLANEKNIREVIMFPLNQNAQDLMMNAPNEIDSDLLKDLGLKVSDKKN